MRQALSLLLIAATALLAGCSDTKPKNLGRNTVLFGDDGTDPGITDNFRFNFAYRNPAATAPLNKIIYLQGAPNSKSTVVSTCNGAGTNCVCEFLDASDVELEETDSTEMSYDNTGNYLRCEFDGDLNQLAKVRLRNMNSTRTSEIYYVDTTLTLQKLIGYDQDINRVRSVYRYSCLYNFLQKQGTTELLFDCSDTGSTCWSGYSSNGRTSGNFCLLQSSFPFHLYASNYDNNFSLKIADKLYYGDSPSPFVCGSQIKQYDCGGTGGTPVKDFGLYAVENGVFTVPLSLTPGPDQTVTNYGFAAPTSIFNGATVCPPGMSRRIFYRTTTSTAPSIGPSHNYPGTLTSTEIKAPGVAVPPLEINKVGGGHCNGTGCTLPGHMDGAVTTYSYSTAGQSEFCVIDPNLLP